MAHPLLVDLTYFPNAVKVEKGKEFLKPCMIQPKYNTRRLVATCCGTPILGDHPSYQGKRIVTYIPPSILKLRKDVDRMPARMRIFQDDLTPEEQGELEPFLAPDNPVKRPEIDMDVVRNEFYNDERGYGSIQSIIEANGPIQYMDMDYDGKQTAWNKSFPDGPYVL